MNIIRKNYIRYSVRIIIVCTFLLATLLVENDVAADFLGNGTFQKPYIVDNYSDLEQILKKNVNEKTYIGIDGRIEITKLINVGSGEFVIFANDKDAQLYKSYNENYAINDKTNPTYCMHIGKDGETKIEFGTVGKYQLILNGRKQKFKEKNMVSSGWMYIYEKGEVVIGEKTKVQNMMNNDSDSGLSNITVYGTLNIYGLITDCEGINGGAICGKGNGLVNIYNPAIITKCASFTEGGALWIKENATLNMYGGTVSLCSSKEEGGGIFVGGKSANCLMESGIISGNSSGNSGGGIFAGYGANLNINSVDENVQVIGNKSIGSGGGIRANGGVGDEAGGCFFANGVVVTDNISNKYGGGISIGTPGAKSRGIVTISNSKIIKNQAQNDGGGINISAGNKGATTDISIDKCTISHNKTNASGGGLYIKSSVVLSNNNINDNHATLNGGGMVICENVNATMYSGWVNANNCDKNGKGVYLQGRFIVGSSADIVVDNDIYICQNRFLEIGKPFNNSYRLSLDSKEKKIGTLLVKVNYNNGTGEKILYGNDIGEEEEYKKSVAKKINHINISGKKLLRSTGYVRDMDSQWIIISRTYQIKYLTDLESAKNMPEKQVKFYREYAYISSVMPTHKDKEVVEELIWNTRVDGNGQIFSPGCVYENDKDLTLYCMWKDKLRLFFDLKDRYYMVGQDIVIDSREALRKVRVYDNDEYSNQQQEKDRYKVKIISIYDVKNKSYLCNNDKGVKNEIVVGILSTKKEGEYLLNLRTEYDKVVEETNMKVFVLKGKNESEGVRFISKEYLYTLSSESKWIKPKNMKILEGSLTGEAKHIFIFDEKEVEQKKEKARNKYGK